MGGTKRVLAIASGGGHWIQLLRLRPAWSGCDVTYANTAHGFHEELKQEAEARGDSPPKYVVLTQANRWNKLQLAWLVMQILVLIIRLRPYYIVSTGAAHGYFAIRIGKLLGCRTIWIDSIANADELSMSGTMAGSYADVWLTQWPHLARPEGPYFRGAVL